MLTGYGSGKSSVENAILNTNLIQLMEAEGISDNMLQTLQEGTHTGRVDTIIQGRIEQYIESGQLRVQTSETASETIGQIRALPGGEEAIQGLKDAGYIRNIKENPFSAFESFLRAKATKSSAITLTTNVGDVSNLTSVGMDYISGTESGLRRVSVDIKGEILNRHIEDLKGLGITGLEERI